MKLVLLIISSFVINISLLSQNYNCTVDSNKRSRIVGPNFPNAFTCYMEMMRGNNEKYGTGFLIHPRVLLSAGHNFSWYPSGPVHSVIVYFGSIDSANYLISDTIKLINNVNKFYKPNYWINGKIQNEFSILILPDSSIYKKTGGCFKILGSSLELKKLSEINITGSPGDKEFFEMWTSRTINYQFDKYKILYDMYTEVRNSGSPIWEKVGNEYYVLGIHSRSWGSCRAATLITSDVINQIREWCKTQNIIL